MLRYFSLIGFLVLGLFTSPVLHAKTKEQQIQEIAWVVFCEDNTTNHAASLVLSTIYNRAGSHDVRELHKAVSAKRQYHCYRMTPTAKKLQSHRYKEIETLVKSFIYFEERPITKAKYFYNHRLVSRSQLGKMKLTVTEVYGSHTYLF